MDNSLIIVKPHAIKLYENIIQDLEAQIGNRATKTHSKYIPSVPKETWEEFYAKHILEYNFFKELLQIDFNNKSAFVSVYNGKGIVKIIRNIIGKTNVLENSENTIRGKYGKIILEQDGPLILSDNTKIYKNVIHATDENPGEFEREFQIFKKYFT